MKHEQGDIEIDVKDEIDLGMINTYSGAKVKVYCYRDSTIFYLAFIKTFVIYKPC